LSSSHPHSEQAAIDVEMRRFFWRNYLANGFEGGIYIGGMALLSADSILPAMIKSLGGPTWLISLMPMMMMLGCIWPPLLTAHWIEGMTHVKPLCMVTGFLQRLPAGIAGIFLLTCADTHPGLVLSVAALAPLVSGLAFGVSMGAWMEMVTRIIPEERRASCWAVRYLVTAVIGVAAGVIVKWVLAESPGAIGYGYLHLICFAFLMLSFAVFSMIREMPRPTHLTTNGRGFSDNIKSLPALVAGNPPLRRFLMGRVLRSGLFVVTPFLAIHALETTGNSDAYLGQLVTVQMIGGIVGNIAAGYLGDRFGGKGVLVVARVILAAVAPLAALSQTSWGFLAVFFLLGFGNYADRVGGATLSVELCPEDRRPTVMSLMMTISFPSMLAAAAASTVLRETCDSLLPAAGVAAFCLLTSVVFLWGIPEPRKGRK
jgi:MFS family permease